MKITTKITAALIAMGIVSHAMATDPVVYLTGSTAFRSIVESALASSAGGTNNGAVFDSAPSYTTYGGSTAGGANYMVFHGTVGGQGVYINCAWSGSEAGIASACNTTLLNQDRDGNSVALAGSPATWIDVTKVTLDGSVNSANPSPGIMESSSHGADLAQADTSQAVSWTPYVAGTQTALNDYGTEGIVTFTWAKNVNTTPDASWASLTNVTLPQLAVELGHGYEFPAFFTGVSSQTNEYVYVVGRNKGSGTRMNALADTGYGTKKSVTQFSIGEGIEVASTGSLLLDYENNNGYESGGGVATALGFDGSCHQQDPFFPQYAGWFAIGYLGCGDAITHGLTVANNWLACDGVQESNGSIEEGQYSFWGHEHLYGKYQIAGIQNTVGQAVFNAVSKNLDLQGYGSVPANHDGGIALKYMHCSKSTDVAYPTR
ncbi:MAG TPA: hypothetical protein VFV23_02600 [Verrucomicrobiae bacterium]|nr:hypothetical protein [Verrucomicrobiae bacterium]